MDRFQFYALSVRNALAFAEEGHENRRPSPSRFPLMHFREEPPMKPWMIAGVCAVLMNHLLWTPTAQASVSGQTYTITGITALADFVDDTYTFNADGSLTSPTASGNWQEVDLGVISFWFGNLTNTENPDFTLNLVGFQLSTFLVSRGIDSNGLVYFLFGEEQQ
jgi:hypothetical protein